MALKVFLGHGASGTAASMRPYVEGLAKHGIDAVALELPRHGRSPVRAELAVGSFFACGTGPAVVIGGRSYGGRVASLAAAQRAYAGLVCFSYPLHRPGHPELAKRIAHWPRISCPVLLLSGDRDPFARRDLLEEAVRRLPNGHLIAYPGAGHGLGGALPEALDAAAQFVRSLDSRSSR